MAETLLADRTIILHLRPVEEVGCGRATYASGVGTPVLRRSGEER